jgi:putative ABC transport system substrate-binding protein
VRRREVIKPLGGAVAAMSPIAAHAQQTERMRRIGVLCPQTRTMRNFRRVGAFLQALALLSWTIGRNVRIDTRWATTNAAEIRRHAAELAALAPDVMLAALPNDQERRYHFGRLEGHREFRKAYGCKSVTAPALHELQTSN